MFKKAAIGISILLLLASGGLAGSIWVIESSLQELCAAAQHSHPHPGDDVAALMDFVASGDHSLKQRNRAVWALGRLCDRRALPLLQTHYNGQPCDHEKFLCQYELKKAIQNCKEPLPAFFSLLRPQKRGG
ncbi:MAG: hypothetical protein PVG60_09155 [Desulfarculaceae bacterium]